MICLEPWKIGLLLFGILSVHSFVSGFVRAWMFDRARRRHPYSHPFVAHQGFMRRTEEKKQRGTRE